MEQLQGNVLFPPLSSRNEILDENKNESFQLSLLISMQTNNLSSNAALFKHLSLYSSMLIEVNQISYMKALLTLNLAELSLGLPLVRLAFNRNLHSYVILLYCPVLRDRILSIIFPCQYQVINKHLAYQHCMVKMTLILFSFCNIANHALGMTIF